MTDEPKIKKCPFCGKRKELTIFSDFENYHVVCENCSAAGPFGNTEAEAWDLWDTRPKRKKRKPAEEQQEPEPTGYPVTALRGLLAALNVATHNCMADTDEIHAANMADLLSQALQHHPESMVASWMTSQINQVDEGVYR